jgi:hypothetical protein
LTELWNIRGGHLEFLRHFEVLVLNFINVWSRLPKYVIKSTLNLIAYEMTFKKSAESWESVEKCNIYSWISHFKIFFADNSCPKRKKYVSYDIKWWFKLPSFNDFHESSVNSTASRKFLHRFTSINCWLLISGRQSHINLLNLSADHIIHVYLHRSNR